MSDKKRPMTALDYIKNQPSMQGKNLNSKSAEITHYPNKYEPTQIAYTTCKILRIQSPHDFGFLNLHTTKPFSQSGYHIQGYTYTDYQNAFFRTLCLRAFDHSWFLSFDSRCPNQVPGWFHEWWYWFGPTNEIYPTDIIKTNFPFYSKHLPKQDIDSFKNISFHIDMGIPWICSWHYNLILLLPGMPYSLVREYRIKWWDKYDLNRCSLTNIAKLFQITSQTKAQVQAVSKSILYLHHKILSNDTEQILKPLHHLQQHNLSKNMEHILRLLLLNLNQPKNHLVQHTPQHHQNHPRKRSFKKCSMPSSNNSKNPTPMLLYKMTTPTAVL
ncbi:unnamed protein product [Arabidopsis lyrata]|uniref:Predicted protein n=1 Tax=Arabidopsis lyrata subsp. lyrata TaxID=81972 RepID=D7LB74_ARALL|nr:predicted protein [Arabidopsis lyrata subsp. lyrata]CAH8262125.1 unnamed protein product [Arabidopsis lyrata]